MSITGNSVGIDYHNRSVQIVVVNESGVVGVRNCRNNVDEVIKYVRLHGPVRGCAIEACTGSANFADELQAKSGWRVMLAHPGYVQRMRHNPDKYDKADAELLGDLHRVGYLPQVWLAPESLRDLRTLMRYRAGLVAERRALKLRMSAILRAHRIPAPCKKIWSMKGLRWLETLKCFPVHTQWVVENLLVKHKGLAKQITDCEKRIADWAQTDAIVQRLLKERGVGLVTAGMMRAEIGTFTRFRTGKELSRYCGVTPRNASSGQKQADAGLIKAGNRLLRATLIQVGHNQRRFTPEWQKFCARLSSRGKTVCIIVAAIVNRWLRKLYHQMVEFECQQQVAA